MDELGVRELKIHASEIVRKVKEKHARYIVTHRGRPVAAIVPVEEAQVDLSNPDMPSAWDELLLLSEKISQGWESPQTPTELLSAMRR